MKSVGSCSTSRQGLSDLQLLLLLLVPLLLMLMQLLMMYRVPARV
jgi:hypothetical protein